MLPSVRLDEVGDLTVDLDRGATLTGHIVPPAAAIELRRLAELLPDEPFAPGRRPHLQLVRPEGSSYFLGRPEEDGRDARLTIADDGSYHATSLEPGVWQIYLCYPTNDSGTWSIEPIASAVVTLTSGAVTEFDLDLGSMMPGTLAGRVVSNSEPMGNALVSISSDRARHQLTTDADGRFEIQCRAGTYRVRSFEHDIVAETTATVMRGQTTQHVFRIVSGGVLLQVRDADGKLAYGARLQLRPGDVQLAATDDQGRVRTVLRPGTYSVRTLHERLGDSLSRRVLVQQAAAQGLDDPIAPLWLEIGSFVVEPGQSHSVELQLPAAWSQ